MDAVVSLATAKARLRVDTGADDDVISAIIAAATQRFDGRDGILGRALLPQSWRLDLPAFPESIELPLPPLILVESITYLDTDFVEQTVSPTIYRVISGGFGRSRIRLDVDQTWPTSSAGEPDTVRVTFQAGYQDLQSPANNPVPEPIVQAILMLAQSMYDRPGQESVPDVVRDLISPYRVGVFGGIHGT
jgi:uncharacterized phiE125 gp8 family phage protein